jgi:hypothetical protein
MRPKLLPLSRDSIQMPSNNIRSEGIPTDEFLVHGMFMLVA